MTDHATGTTSARRSGTAGLAAGVLALLLAATGCSSTGTTAAPVPPTTAAPTTAAAPSTQAPSTPASSAPQSAPPPVAPSASAPVEPSASAEPVPVIYDCTGQQLSEPRSISVGCGAGTGQLDGLTWKDWGGLAATGTGRLWQKTAAGGVAAYPATVTLGGLAGGGYTTMRISAPKAEKANVELVLGRTGPTVKD
ncbi:hypothetical protein ACFVVX_09120 [Kitasatospora sp. NPDC058170]|uniref:hypothetical protein n=1 Tax=Kitasatospora sp. NPDC058170 TaxID=3346364 RepID=UPI0036DF7CE8